MSAGPTLTLTGLTVRFGGLTAVDDVSLTAPAGQITALIGPNGAGKTTTFNAATGYLRPTQGTVRLDGRDISRTSPSTRARAGIGRTFQRFELFDSLTVRDNVAFGFEGPLAGRNPARHILAGRGAAQRRSAATDQALELCGIEHLAAECAGTLTTGRRRLVELARLAAGPYRVLLLDEPASGLDDTETRQLESVLRHLRTTRGAAVLIVEHDVDLVMRISDHIHVMDFGRHIFDGPPEEVAASSVVRAAYLGQEVV